MTSVRTGRLLASTIQKENYWLFRYVILASIPVHFRLVLHESSSYSRGYIHIYVQRFQGRRGPLASRYASSLSSAWASWRSAVSKPSVNQPCTAASRSCASCHFPCCC